MSDFPSRYDRLGLVDLPDAHGRPAAGTAVRPLPSTSGTVLHRLTQTDRLDALAARYYGQPLLWWHICDANTGVLSPLELIGWDVVAVTDLPVRSGDDPAWAALLRALSARPGVERVVVLPGDDATGRPSPDVVRVEHVAATTTVADLLVQVSAAGFELTGAAQTRNRLGQAVVVPPPVSG